MDVVPFGKPRAERADAVRNREHLLAVVRELIAEHGVEKVTMDGLAERAGLGKGTVFRRFGSRAGIFRALLEDDESRFQQRVLSGPPPLGPGAGPAERLIAYGRERIPYLLRHHAFAQAAAGPGRPDVGSGISLTRLHVRMLLGEAGVPEPDGLALQLSAALEGPVLFYLRPDAAEPAPGAELSLVESWRTLVERVLTDDARG
ncbi:MULTISPECIES: TetR/AcrR family transcriptional regulator [unclassified Saccharopolyspora]|uniref:TetR/AcrR family transcriptional regulator n=1 Tax=unclassified Saccharopolyspora TaxID=2646250 RepID=UPI001CD4867F|nr:MULTISPECIES: TetR/AcrR family transcriptional regulator [unclassified Saccharopolyspora]MCA1189556.1 TetR/AcrR family transcriptional regulator [Saccharopolyspora sp. 6T]MCA1195725.1 TetR/AcrR family transcriptional regulator [Saccharopolyspora sp. 6V]MCA1228998.1 TetR/AcrR family transcriptional regulator [Saccharopolyspora sp. 6M]MCA1282797.1 TetR/AcrR family transcriptional regulator [Saccharopolyspora sp. 7B]